MANKSGKLDKVFQSFKEVCDTHGFVWTKETIKDRLDFVLDHLDKLELGSRHSSLKVATKDNAWEVGSVKAFITESEMKEGKSSRGGSCINRLKPEEAETASDKLKVWQRYQRFLIQVIYLDAQFINCWLHVVCVLLDSNLDIVSFPCFVLLPGSFQLPISEESSHPRERLWQKKHLPWIQQKGKCVTVRLSLNV